VVSVTSIELRIVVTYCANDIGTVIADFHGGGSLATRMKATSPEGRAHSISHLDAPKWIPDLKVRLGM
jgi:hypothetical protein